MALKKHKSKVGNKFNNQKTNLSFSFCINSLNISAQKVVLRIIDANLNRCKEGLRVVEDSLRFVLNDGKLYKKVRAIRHNTDKILRNFYSYIIEKRNSLDDSGRQIPETSKKDLPSIVVANFKRAQESLRVLEEYSKNFYPEFSPEFKRQRYKTYIIEKEVYLKYKDFFVARYTKRKTFK
jgi:thiamine-phosphate pyrophosphorylase